MGRRYRLALVATVCVCLAGCVSAPAEQTEGAFADGFSAAELDPATWVVTRQNDFQEAVIDLVDGRLRMRAATIGTDDKTVKFQGVRTTAAVVDLGKPCRVAFELDWNDQANGCYLTAGAYLCPVATDENPRDEDDWLKLQYVGVPPGKNARCVVATKTSGRLRQVHTEGWPTEQRVGRKIGVQRIEITFQDRALRVEENGELLYETADHGLTFETAYLYLQMSTHSNYPPREVFFDDVVVAEP